MPRVAVIITSYNEGECLRETVRSALDQRFTDFEVVVVDGGSTDPATLQVIGDLESRGLRIIRATGSTLPQARNTGIEAVDSELISCLDGDDKMAFDYLYRTTQTFADVGNPKLGIVTTHYRHFGASTRFITIRPFEKYLLAVDNQLHPASLFRRQCWEEIGGYRLNTAEGMEDWDFWIAIVSRDYEWRVVPEPLFFYRVRKGSRSNLIDEQSRHYQRELRKIVHTNNIDYFAESHSFLVDGFARLHRMENSLSWRITWPLRIAYDFLVGPLRRTAQKSQSALPRKSGISKP